MDTSAKAVASLATALVVLAACGGPGGLGQGGGFENRYVVARNALDAGRYDVAISGFQTLISETANPMVTHRLTLELAHSQLRQGDYIAAGQTARALADASEGEARGLALAVAGTAQHEQARVHASAGEPLEARALLTLAEADLSEMVAMGGDLDTGGSMAERLRIIRAELGR